MLRIAAALNDALTTTCMTHASLEFGRFLYIYSYCRYIERAESREIKALVEYFYTKPFKIKTNFMT